MREKTKSTRLTETAYRIASDCASDRKMYMVDWLQEAIVEKSNKIRRQYESSDK